MLKNSISFSVDDAISPFRNRNCCVAQPARRLSLVQVQNHNDASPKTSRLFRNNRSRLQTPVYPMHPTALLSRTRTMKYFDGHYTLFGRRRKTSSPDKREVYSWKFSNIAFAVVYCVLTFPASHVQLQCNNVMPRCILWNIVSRWESCNQHMYLWYAVCK